MDRVLTCEGCGKQRWAPRVPEALHGWVVLSPGRGKCPDCQAPAASGANSTHERKQ